MVLCMREWIIRRIIRWSITLTINERYDEWLNAWFDKQNKQPDESFKQRFDKQID